MQRDRELRKEKTSRTRGDTCTVSVHCSGSVDGLSRHFALELVRKMLLHKCLFDSSGLRLELGEEVTQLRAFYWCFLRSSLCWTYGKEGAGLFFLFDSSLHQLTWFLHDLRPSCVIKPTVVSFQTKHYTPLKRSSEGAEPPAVPEVLVPSTGPVPTRRLGGGRSLSVTL